MLPKVKMMWRSPRRRNDGSWLRLHRLPTQAFVAVECVVEHVTNKPAEDNFMTVKYPFGGVVSGAAPAALDSSAIWDLVKGLADPLWWVRLLSAEALGTIGEPARLAVYDLVRTAS